MNEKRYTYPFIKWAGGKTQLLPELVKYIPSEFDKYIEPFLGGGALFFYLMPEKAIISDQNPELICTYKIVKNNVNSLISELQSYPNDSDFYYAIRRKNVLELDEVQRAARFIYLNKTSYNGLYRVNKKGDYNVPFGNQKNPKICDPERLISASHALENALIIESDYIEVIDNYASKNDFVFLDPPYHPVSNYADFTRFTKYSFYEEDQIQLSKTFRKLYEMGVNVVLTNSNTEFTRRLYQEFPFSIVNTKRLINSKSNKRIGEDLIVFTEKNKIEDKFQNPSKTSIILNDFPSTRFMGSKYAILDFIWESVGNLQFDSVLDAFSGSGCVSYLFKKQGKQVFSNDILNFSYHISNSLIANNYETLDNNDISILLSKKQKYPRFIQEKFHGLYFTDEENDFLDRVRFNINKLNSPFKKSLAISALNKSCLKKRPRGIFTYVGDKYNDNRKDIRLNIQDHFLNAIREFNNAVFDNRKINQAFNQDIFSIDLDPDLVYLDPPYYTEKSDNDYVRRYHFVEGLSLYWEGLSIQEHTKTKKFKSYETCFSSKESTYLAFNKIFERYKKSIIVVSYSSNCLPTKNELSEMIKQVKKNIVVMQLNHMYSFGNQYRENESNNVVEYLFIGY